jgi:predicted nucleic-acid-binding protein
MIGLDTNVIVRAAIDDPGEPQTEIAKRRLASLTIEEPGFITHIVLVEVWWVLTRAYDYSRDQALVPLDKLVDMAVIVLQEVEVVEAALAVVRRTGADFADALIVEVAKAAGAGAVETFDRQAISRAGMAPVTHIDPS